ncbi:GGDEF domain-containing protein [Exiguobacterium alkaliphilum]|uniref:GGDEF domain-containing protein n=1 Tax=Exiguobacterium alkaliphilum TaxID=1428684 RepID=UPI003463A24E
MGEFSPSLVKAVNDTYGHLNGDRMLQEYARSLKKATFTKANVARLGGDEFLVVTTDRMNETEIPAECTIYVDGSAVRLAASIGKASYPVDGRTLDSLFEVADRSMYRRKSALKRERTEK